MALRPVLGSLIAAPLVAAGLLVWLSTPAYTASAPLSASPRSARAPALILQGPDGEDRRRTLIRQASFDYETPPPRWPSLDVCWYVPGEPSGTTPKFDCAFANGEVLKVKYGGGPEPHAEVATTELLKGMGYAADHVTFTPKLRCYGCPRYPFIAMQVASRVRAVGLPALLPVQDGYTDFAWVSVERRLELRPVESTTSEGWAWWELRRSAASRAELDAFRLLAVFLGHWDNKAANQRLVCRDDACTDTLAMIQDVGATFGPSKVNLAAWRREPIWADLQQCRISMSRLPFSGATFEDAIVSEDGRRLLLNRLNRITEDRLRRIFTDARFPEFHSATDDRRDLDAWVEAFQYRVMQIERARCAD